MAEQRRGKPGASGSGRAGGQRRTTGGTGRGPARSSRGTGDDKRREGRSAGQRRPDRASGAGPRSKDARSSLSQEERTAAQQVYDGPPLPDDITGKELAPDVRAQLRTLPEKLAQRVARHLAAAGAVIDDDPETAYQHSLAARSRAPRLAVVREAAGEAAYAAGHYSEALAELRAAKRMNGATAYLPIMADCHRALGNAKRALELAKSPSVKGFPAAAKAEMTIVEAGARRDLGQFDAALRTLELSPINSKSRESWVVRLRYAYADTLEQAGKERDALSWFHRTNAIDAEEITDAAGRAAALEKRLDG
ncbi:tetratricopeptide repeat protein [Nocardioides bizhenqiangii]|uniref:Tetratricopeptide repeat protein n=1 Tax=Nocardioides bizhenqiangii TaxID=3095076 RepID=A0ABZ0ZVL5_9ACTN|nr:MULTISPECIES: tetratricopeptide repeat protein [unclassified Nocardioides]MDZ5623519.1 tetratricopeptide repeat protein [Nocardioides sp. HM23]WQQ28302.1 tetratricopeptide repeat protein [Nocardioides sp. HM61]